MKTASIDEVLSKNKFITNIYFTAGYPELNSTTTMINSLAELGCKMIEIGLPYSDPLADGPTIQYTNQIALKNGISLEKIFEQLREINSCSETALVAMGYMNQVLQFGYEKFCQNCYNVGISGIIIPDMTPLEYQNRFKQWVDTYHLKFIFLITPDTEIQRILYLDSLSTGFLYIVSQKGITGKQLDYENTVNFLKKLNSLPLKNHKFVGFGIKTYQDVLAVRPYTKGVIIGSEFVKQFNVGTDIYSKCQEFLKSIKISTD